MSFAGGELSPSMFGRFDDQRYASGLATCRNFITLPQGPAVVRPGTSFVAAAKYAGKRCRLIPFTFSVTETMVLEFGDKYVRFHTFGQTLLKSDGSVYEISSPYAAEDLDGIRFVQSMDVMTLVHTKYPPRELRRYGATDWRFESVTFGAPLPTPSAPTATFKVVAGDGVTITDEEKTRYTLKYKVTALRKSMTGTEESEASGIGSVQGNLYLTNATVTLTWSAVPGAERYRVYKNYKGMYCYIGETDELTFIDDNYEPDASITPPIYENPFTDDYPGAVCYFEQRKCFAGTQKYPQMVWMTRSGTEADMSYTLPAQDDNRLRFQIAAQEASRILHLAPLNQLLALTNSTEYRISSGGSGPMAPDAIDSKAQAQIGASSVQPVVVNSALVYVAARGGHVRELGYNWQASGFTTGDLSIRAGHFFERARPTGLSLAKSPDSIVWMPMSDGSLIGLTYLPEQGVGGWHRHTTENGFIESVTAVAEDDEDILYLVVRREINGQTVRYIERMHERYFDVLENAWCVDCGGEYRGNATSTVSGLAWLEGQTVSILADGCVLPQCVVTNGRITLSQPAKHVIVGLPITADLQTLPVAIQLQDGSFGMGHMKNMNDIFVRVYKSSGVFMGPDFENLVEVKQRTTEPYGSPPEMVSKEVSVLSHCQWNDGGQICIRQMDPLPLTVVSIAWDLAK